MVINTDIDKDVERRASEILGRKGMTVADAVRLLLARTAREGMLPFDPAGEEDHDAWFRAKVQEALDDPAPDLEDAEAEDLIADKKRLILNRARGNAN